MIIAAKEVVKAILLENYEYGRILTNDQDSSISFF